MKAMSDKRRIGTLTSGLSLIAAGIVFLLNTLIPNANILEIALAFWPLVLIMLGIEIIVSCAKKEVNRGYDLVSVVLVGMSVAFAFACEIARQYSCFR